MGLFNIFKKQESPKSGSYELTIKEVCSLTAESVKISFVLSDNQKQDFQFKPGQYVDIESTIGGEKIRRSYSICSTNFDDLSIGVKTVPNGKMTNFLHKVKPGDSLNVSVPKGNFTASGAEEHIVCIAAGSGITPILSILSHSNAKKELFYVNKSLDQMMFKEELLNMSGLTKHFYLTQKSEENYLTGRLTKEVFIAKIKADLTILKATAFFICGPHEMVLEIKEALKMFGVSENKIKIELFQAVVTAAPKENVVFNGESSVEVVLDGESTNLILNSTKKTILESLEAKGVDAPYSCRGGVCCSCKAKVLEGSVTMKVNYSLTDEEVASGYILACQALPASSKIKISFDE